MDILTVLKEYNIDIENIEVNPIKTGLINSTWLVEERTTNNRFIFQKVNVNVFKLPENITNNIRLIDDYLKENHPDYLFTSPIKSIAGEDMIKAEDGGYYRLFEFISGSVTHNNLTKPIQAYQAAKQFGKFTKLLSGIHISQINITIPDFHNLTLRYNQFIESMKSADHLRIKKSKEIIHFLLENKNITEYYQNILNSDDFKLRVTHHDTKISNVLFDEEDNGLCVIDLDTVMPGYFISDLGDMMRTYLSPVSEEEKDLDKIEVRTEFFKAIIKGYLSEMSDELSELEKSSIIYAGKFMIYMQALRFLTDYLNNDIYYGSRYPDHNLVRAMNQAKLLEKYLEKEQQFAAIITDELDVLN